jgi:hypothetical protein
MSEPLGEHDAVVAPTALCGCGDRRVALWPLVVARCLFHTHRPSQATRRATRPGMPLRPVRSDARSAFGVNTRVGVVGSNPPFQPPGGARCTRLGPQPRCAPPAAERHVGHTFTARREVVA